MVAGEYRGSCKTLVKSIKKMRTILRRRGPWPKVVGLREYHDQLLSLIARKPKRKLDLSRL